MTSWAEPERKPEEPDKNDIDARLAAIEARLAAVEARPTVVTWVPLTGSWTYSNPIGYQCPRCHGWVQPCAGHWCAQQ